MQGTRAAGAGPLIDIDKALNPRQMRRQGAAVAAPMRRTPLRLFPLAVCMVSGFDLLDLFEREQQLIFRQGLGPAAEAMTL